MKRVSVLRKRYIEILSISLSPPAGPLILIQGASVLQCENLQRGRIRMPTETGREYTLNHLRNAFNSAKRSWGRQLQVVMQRCNVTARPLKNLRMTCLRLNRPFYSCVLSDLALHWIISFIQQFYSLLYHVLVA